MAGVIKKVCFALLAVSVVAFGVAFIAVAGSGEDGAWGAVLGASILVFVVAMLAVQFAGQGLGRAEGPKSFDALDARPTPAPTAPGDPGVRPARTWTRTWLNVYFWTGAGELYLGGLFIAAGAVSSDPNGLEGGLGVGGILAAVGAIFGYLAYRTAAKNKLHDTGLEGRATIVGVKQTGMWLNNNPVTVLDLKIKLDGHPEYEVRHRETVPQVAIGRLTSGVTLPVRVNPHHPSDFIVEWERV